MNGLTAVSRLDRKLGARLAGEISRAHDHRGPVAAGRHRDWAVGIEAADELLYKRLPFPEGGRVVRRETQSSENASGRIQD
jgi:hypothetical protein